MSKFNIDSFITTFFQQHDCDVNIMADGVFDIQLTEKIDRAIMNRPFYWHYVQATGRVGEPQRLRLRTNLDNDSDEGEWIHFGTPRMNDLCQFLEKTSRFIRVFEQINVQSQTPLHPWLIINGNISYKGKQIREEVVSIGLNLINGIMIERAMEQLQTVTFGTTISPQCFIITPLIKIRSGFQRIEQYIEHHVQHVDDTWAHESVKLLKDELLLLNHFYQNKNEKNDLIKEVTQLYDRLRPEINFSIINGGLFYVRENFPNNAVFH